MLKPYRVINELNSVSWPLRSSLNIHSNQGSIGIGYNDEFKEAKTQSFEEIDELDKAYLNSYETGLSINKEYILTLYKEMEDIPFDDNWEVRVDTPEAKWYTAINGTKFSK